MQVRKTSVPITYQSYTWIWMEFGMLLRLVGFSPSHIHCLSSNEYSRERIQICDFVKTNKQTTTTTTKKQKQKKTKTKLACIRTFADRFH